MRYSIEPRDKIYVKRYGSLSFGKNMGKSLSNKYGQKLLYSTKNLQQIQLKQHLKEQFKKQLKQRVI